MNCTTTDVSAWLDSARRAEDLGYTTYIAQDHFANQLAPMPALVAAADVTRHLRLATLVLDNDFRHPALVAKEAATVDVLSGGRLEFGLGAGWLEADYVKTGLPLDPPATRLERLQEAVHICTSLLSSTESISFTGKHYQIEDLEPLPRPVQHPRPPLMLGGRQKRMLTFAAREADIVGISLLDPRGPELPQPPSFAQKVAWVRDAAGERLSSVDLHVNASLIEVADHPNPTELERIAARTRQTPEQVLASPGSLVGSVNEIVETLHARRETFGVNYYVVQARHMERLAPIVARLAGT